MSSITKQLEGLLEEEKHLIGSMIIKKKNVKILLWRKVRIFFSNNVTENYHFMF